MFFKLFSLFAVLAVALAAPKPDPQLLTYPSALDYSYPLVGPAVAPAVVSPYSAPLAYPYAGLPAAYYVR